MLSLFLSVAYAQGLGISIEYDSDNSNFIHILYWVNNDMGEDIPNVEYILNDSYFYSSNLPARGDYLEVNCKKYCSLKTLTLMKFHYTSD